MAGKRKYICYNGAEIEWRNAKSNLSLNLYNQETQGNAYHTLLEFLGLCEQASELFAGARPRVEQKDVLSRITPKPIRYNSTNLFLHVMLDVLNAQTIYKDPD